MILSLLRMLIPPNFIHKLIVSTSYINTQPTLKGDPLPTRSPILTMSDVETR